VSRQEALGALHRAGMIGMDAETALDYSLRGFRDVDSMLASISKNASNTELMNRFGQDGGRAVLALRAHA
jgi:hypothetical protein